MQSAKSIWVILLFALAAWYSIGLDARDFWVDEIWTIEYGSISPGKILSCPDPVHPPLYYLCIHFWMIFGQDEWVMRSFSVLCILIAHVLLYRFVRRVFGGETALVTSLLFALSPAVYLYAREARPYAMFICAFILSADAFHRAVIERGGMKWGIAYIVASLLMILTHYAAFVLIPVHVMLILILRRMRPRWEVGLPLVAPALLMIAGFLVWGGLWRGIWGNVARSLIPQPFEMPLQWVGEIVYTVYVFCFGETLLPWRFPLVAAGLAALGIAFVFGVRELFRSRREEFWFLISLFAIPVAGVCMATARASPRYLIFSIIPFLVVVAFGFCRPRPVLLRAAAAILLCPIGFSLWNYHRGEEFHNLAHVEPSRKAAEEIMERAVGDDIVLFLQPHKPMGHYLHGALTTTRVAPDYRGEDDAVVERMTRSIKEAAVGHDRAFLVRTSPGGIRAAGRIGLLDRRVELALQNDPEVELIDVRRYGFDPERREKERWVAKYFMDYRISITLFRIRRSS